MKSQELQIITFPTESLDKRYKNRADKNNSIYLKLH